MNLRTASSTITETVDLLRETLSLYRRGFWRFISIAAIFHVPLTLAGWAAWVVAATTMLPLMSTAVSLLAIPLEGVAISYIAVALNHDQRSSVGSALRLALQQLWPALRLAALLAGGMLVAAIADSVVGPVIVDPIFAVARPLGAETAAAVRRIAAILTHYAITIAIMAPCSLALPLLVAEQRASAWGALRQSLQLVRGAWLRVTVGLGVLVALSWGVPLLVLVLVAALRESSLFVPVITSSGYPVPSLTETLLLMPLGIALGPFLWIGLSALYFARTDCPAGRAG